VPVNWRRARHRSLDPPSTRCQHSGQNTNSSPVPSDSARIMARDVKREIETARDGHDAGNFLCALALLCYTEVLGGIRRGTLASGNGRTNFECFFRELGPEYERLLDDGVDAYRLFRCGMAHEYLIKGRATVSSPVVDQRV
jgi:hypothetical protein